MTLPLRQPLLRAARALGLPRWMRRRHADELLVLTYHSVTTGVQEIRQRHPLVYRNAVSAARFERQMQYLKRHYTLLDGDALRAVLTGNAPMPDRAVAVTFDDGLLNNATVALPILKRLEVPAFFFLPTGFVDAASEGTLRRHWSEDLIARFSFRSGDDPLSPESIGRRLPSLTATLTGCSPTEAMLRAVDHLKNLPPSKRTDRLAALRDLIGDAPPASAIPAAPDGPSLLATMTWHHARAAATDGITLGGHTVNHESLAQLPTETAETEITRSLQAIEDHTGAPAQLFSYPYGRPDDVSKTHKSILLARECCGAFTQITGFNDASTDPFFLRRIDVSPNYSLEVFAYIASGTKRAVDRVVRGRRPPSSP